MIHNLQLILIVGLILLIVGGCIQQIAAYKLTKVRDTHYRDQSQIFNLIERKKWNKVQLLGSFLIVVGALAAVPSILLLSAA